MYLLIYYADTTPDQVSCKESSIPQTKHQLLRMKHTATPDRQLASYIPGSSSFSVTRELLGAS